MTLPARIRVNVAAPFPALVTGANGISLGKQNGIWSVALNTPSLATSFPSSTQFPNDYVVIWDSTTGVYTKVALTSFSSAAIGTRTQRSVTTSPITVAAADGILNCNITSGSPTCTLPASATRAGLPLMFKDIGAQFGLHPLTISAAVGEFIDGAGSITLSVARQCLSLWPLADGVNSGWLIEK